MVDWTIHDYDTTLGILLDALGDDGRELVAVLDRGHGVKPGTWLTVAVFKQYT
jgi:hypothetical protein